MVGLYIYRDRYPLPRYSLSFLDFYSFSYPRVLARPRHPLTSTRRRPWTVLSRLIGSLGF